MKTNKLGKILVVALFVMLFVLVLTVSVSAANKNVTTEAELTSALSSAASGDTITVTDNFTITKTAEVKENVTLIVNSGKTLSGNDAAAPMFKVTAAKTFTVKGPGTIKGAHNIIQVAASGAKVVLNSGTLTTAGSGNSGSIVYDAVMGNATTVEITGATLSGANAWAVNFHNASATGTGKKTIKMTSGTINTAHSFVFNTNKADLPIDIQVTGGSITTKNTIVYLFVGHSTNKATINMSKVTLDNSSGSDCVIRGAVSAKTELTLSGVTATSKGRFVFQEGTGALSATVKDNTKITSKVVHDNQGLFHFENASGGKISLTFSGCEIDAPNVALFVAGTRQNDNAVTITGSKIVCRDVLNTNSGGAATVTLGAGADVTATAAIFSNGGAGSNPTIAINVNEGSTLKANYFASNGVGATGALSPVCVLNANGGTIVVEAFNHVSNLTINYNVADTITVQGRMMPLEFANATGAVENTTTGVKYDTLKAAIEGAAAGDVITILSNITVTENITLDKDLTIDGVNGVSIDFTNSARFVMAIGADVIFECDNVYFVQFAVFADFATKGEASLHFKGGIYSSTADIIRITDLAALTVTFEEGCEFHQIGDAHIVRKYEYNGKAGTGVENGDTLSGFATTKLIFNGGYFAGAGQYMFASRNANDEGLYLDITINGGEFVSTKTAGDPAYMFATTDYQGYLQVAIHGGTFRVDTLNITAYAFLNSGKKVDITVDETVGDVLFDSFDAIVFGNRYYTTITINGGTFKGGKLLHAYANNGNTDKNTGAYNQPGETTAYIYGGTFEMTSDFVYTAKGNASAAKCTITIEEKNGQKISIKSSAAIFSVCNTSTLIATIKSGSIETASHLLYTNGTPVTATVNVQGGEIVSTRNDTNGGLCWVSATVADKVKVNISGGTVTALKLPLLGISKGYALVTVSDKAYVNTHSLINDNTGPGYGAVTITGGTVELVSSVFFDAGGSGGKDQGITIPVTMTGGSLTAKGIFPVDYPNKYRYYNMAFTFSGDATYNGVSYLTETQGFQVGETIYSDLQDAIDNAADDAEIVILGDYTLSGTAGVTINKNVTITGGSQDNPVTFYHDQSGTYDPKYDNSFCTFTVADGYSLTLSGYVNYISCGVIVNGAANTTTTVTFTGNVRFDAGMHFVLYGVDGTGGTVVVNVAENAYLRGYHVINSGSANTIEVNVSGGTIESTNSSAIYIADAVYAKITVTGGSFTGVSNAFRPVRTHCDIEVTGGTFDIDGHLVHSTDFTGTVTVTGETQVISCNYAFVIETNSDTAVTSALTDAVTVKKDQTNTMSATPDVVVTVSGNAQITSNGYMFQHNGNLHVKVDIVGAVQMTCGGARFFYLKDHSNSSAKAGEWTVINVGADAQGNVPALKFAGNFLHFDSVGKDHSYYNLNVSAGTVESTATNGNYAFVSAGDANARMIATITGGTFRRAEGVSSTGTLCFIAYTSNPTLWADVSNATIEDIASFWTDSGMSYAATATLCLSGNVSISSTQTDAFPGLFYIKNASILNLTIDGGTFTATEDVIYSASGKLTVTVNGGTFTTPKYFTNINNSTGTLTLGGTAKVTAGERGISITGNATTVHTETVNVYKTMDSNGQKSGGVKDTPHFIVNVTGGELTAEKNAIYFKDHVKAHVKISGGTLATTQTIGGNNGALIFKINDSTANDWLVVDVTGGTLKAQDYMFASGSIKDNRTYTNVNITDGTFTTQVAAGVQSYYFATHDYSGTLLVDVSGGKFSAANEGALAGIAYNYGIQEYIYLHGDAEFEDVNFVLRNVRRSDPDAIAIYAIVAESVKISGKVGSQYQAFFNSTSAGKTYVYIKGGTITSDYGMIAESEGTGTMYLEISGGKIDVKTNNLGRSVIGCYGANYKDSNGNDVIHEGTKLYVTMTGGEIVTDGVLFGHEGFVEATVSGGTVKARNLVNANGAVADLDVTVTGTAEVELTHEVFYDAANDGCTADVTLAGGTLTATKVYQAEPKMAASFTITGGTYNGAAYVKNEQGVAAIGSTYYGSLQAAIDSITDDSTPVTITLVGGMTVTETVVIDKNVIITGNGGDADTPLLVQGKVTTAVSDNENAFQTFKIAAGKSVTFAGNVRYLTSTFFVDESTEAQATTITFMDKVEILNSDFADNKIQPYAIAALNAEAKGTLTINLEGNVHITACHCFNLNSGMSYAFNMKGSATLTSIANTAVYVGGGSKIDVKMTGGTIEGVSLGFQIWIDSSVEITGGTFDVNGNVLLLRTGTHTLTMKDVTVTKASHLVQVDKGGSLGTAAKPAVIENVTATISGSVYLSEWNSGPNVVHIKSGNYTVTSGSVAFLCRSVNDTLTLGTQGGKDTDMVVTLNAAAHMFGGHKELRNADDTHDIGIKEANRGIYNVTIYNGTYYAKGGSGKNLFDLNEGLDGGITIHGGIFTIDSGNMFDIWGKYDLDKDGNTIIVGGTACVDPTTGAAVGYNAVDVTVLGGTFTSSGHFINASCYTGVITVENANIVKCNRIINISGGDNDYTGEKDDKGKDLTAYVEGTGGAPVISDSIGAWMTANGLTAIKVKDDLSGTPHIVIVINNVTATATNHGIVTNGTGNVYIKIDGANTEMNVTNTLLYRNTCADATKAWQVMDIKAGKFTSPYDLMFEFPGGSLNPVDSLFIAFNISGGEFEMTNAGTTTNWKGVRMFDFHKAATVAIMNISGGTFKYAPADRSKVTATNYFFLSQSTSHTIKMTGGTIQGFEKAFWCLRGTTNITLGAEGATTFPTIQVSKVLVDTTASSWEGGGCTTNITIWGGEYTVTDYIFYVANGKKRADNSGDHVATLNFTIHGGKYTATSLVYQEKLESANESVIGSAAAPSLIKTGEFTMSGNVICAAYADIYLTIDGGTYRAVRAEGDTSNVADHRILDLEGNSGALVLTVNGGDFESDGEFIRTDAATRTLTIKKGKIVVNKARAIYMTGSPSSCTIVMGDANNKGNITDLTVQAGSGFQIFPMHIGSKSFTLTIYSGKYTATNGSGLFDINASTSGSITIYGGEFSNTKSSNAGHLFDIGDKNGKKIDVTVNGGKFTSDGYFVANNGNSGTITVNGGDITAPHIFVQNGDKPTGGKITGDANKVTVNKTGTMQADGTIVYDSVSELPDVVFIVTGGKIHGKYSVFYTDSPSKIKVDISGSPEIICDGSSAGTGLFHVTKAKGDTMVWTVINISGTPTVKGGNQLMFQQTSISPNSGYTHALNVNITGGTFTQSYNVERTASYLFAAYDGNGIMCLKISDATFKWEDLDEDGNPVAKIGDPRVILAQCERVSAEVTDTTFDGFGILALGNRANGIFNVVLDNVTNQNCTLYNYYTKDDGTKVDEGSNTGLLYTNNTTQTMNVVIKGGTLNCPNGPIFGNSGKMNAVVLSGTLNAKSLINMNGGSVDADITITGTADVNLTGYVFIDAPNTATSQTDLLISGGTVDATALFDRNMNDTATVTITGGYYNGAGHVLNENGVAQIGNSYYASLQEAINAVTGDTKDAPVTVTLIGVHTITETVVINKNVIITGQGDKEGAPLLVYGAVTATAPSDASLLATFQIVAGYSVTFAGDVLYHTCGFFMEESAEGQDTAVTFKDTVEVRNVEISANNIKSYAFAARNANAKGTLTVNLEGNAHLTARHCIVLASAGMSYAVNIKDNATLTSIQSTCVYVSGGKRVDVTVSGGTFNGSSNAFQFLVGADVEITGGTFDVNGNVILFRQGNHSLTMKNATVKKTSTMIQVQDGGNLGTAAKPAVIESVTVTQATGNVLLFNKGTHFFTFKNSTVTTAKHGVGSDNTANLGSAAVPAVLENVTMNVTGMTYYSDWDAGTNVIHVKSGTYTSVERAFCSRGINDTVIMGEQKSIGKNDLLKVTVAGSFQVFAAHHELNSVGGGNIAANRATYNLTVYNGTYTNSTANCFFDANRGVGGSVTIHSGVISCPGTAFDLTQADAKDTVDPDTGEFIAPKAIDIVIKGGTFTTNGHLIDAAYYTGVISIENANIVKCQRIVNLSGDGTTLITSDSIGAWMTEKEMDAVQVKEGLSGTPHIVILLKDVVAAPTNIAVHSRGCGNVLLDISGDKTEISSTNHLVYRDMYYDLADAWYVINISGGKLTSAGQAGFYFPGNKNAVDKLHIAINVSGGEFVLTRAAVNAGTRDGDGNITSYVADEHRGVSLVEVWKAKIWVYMNVTGGTFTYAPVGTVGEGQIAPESYFFQNGNNHTEITMTGGTIQGFDKAFWGNRGGDGLMVTLGALDAEGNLIGYPTINVNTAIFYTAPHYYDIESGMLTATIWGGEYTVENGYIFYVNGYNHVRDLYQNNKNTWRSGTMNFAVHGGTFNAKHFLYHWNGNTGINAENPATIDGDVTINATAQPFYFRDNNAYLKLDSADIEVIANTHVFLAESPMDNLTITINGGTYKALVPESATDADRATANYYRGFRIFSLQCQNEENRKLNVTVNGGTFESDGEFMWVGRWRERNITVKAGTINVHYERFIYITEGGATAKGNIVLGDAENVNVNDKLFVTTHAKKGGTGNQLFVNHNGYFELTVYGGTYVSKAYSFVDLNGGAYVGGKINVLGGDFTVNTHFIDAEGSNNADADKTIVLDVTFSGGTVNASGQFIHAKAVTGTFTFSGGTVNCQHGFVVQGDQPTTKFTADTDKVTVKTTATKNADGTITYATIEEAPDVIIIVTGGTVTATHTVFHITKNNNVLVNVSGDDTVLTAKGSDKLFWRSNDVKNASRWSVLNVTGTPTFICGNAQMFSMATIESDHSYFNINIAGGNFIMNSTAGGDQYFFYNGDWQGIMSIDISGGTFKWENNTEGALKKGNIHGVAADAYYTNIELANATFEGLDVLIDGKRAAGYSNVVIDNCTVDCTSSAFRASGSCIDATVSNSTITAHALTNITGVGAVIITDDGSNTFNVNTVTNPSYVYIVVDEDTYGYGTFEGAVTHAPNGATAYVVGDLTVGSTATLNTKLTIAGKGSVNGSVVFITLVDGAELILNGDVTYTGTTNIVNVADTATGTVSVTFGKGTYRVSGSGSGCAVFLDSSLTANTTVNVEDGADIRVGGWGVAFGDNRGSDGSGIKTVNMTGGYLSGSHGITFAMGGVQANITVSGGTIETANENFYMDNKQFNAGGQNNVTNLTITGGKFITAGNMIMFNNDSAATITISNITVDGVNRLVYMNSSATVNTTLNDVTATVKGGVIVAYDHETKDGKCKGTATVNGGSYTLLSDSFVLNNCAALTVKVNRSKADDQEPVINAKKYIAYTYNSVGVTYAVKTDFEITAGVFECGSGMFIYTDDVTGNVTISGGTFVCTVNSSNGTANGPIHADATVTFNISGGVFTSELAPMFGHSGTLVANLSGGEFNTNYLVNANGTVANETVNISGNAVVNASIAVLTDGTKGSVMYLNIAGGKVVAPLLHTGAFQIASTVTFTGGELTVRDVTMNGNVIGNVNVVLNETTGTYYTTLEEAVLKAADKDVLVLISNVIVIRETVVVENKSITIKGGTPEAPIKVIGIIDSPDAYGTRIYGTFKLLSNASVTFTGDVEYLETGVIAEGDNITVTFAGNVKFDNARRSDVFNNNNSIAEGDVTVYVTENATLIGNYAIYFTGDNSMTLTDAIKSAYMSGGLIEANHGFLIQYLNGVTGRFELTGGTMNMGSSAIWLDSANVDGKRITVVLDGITIESKGTGLNSEDTELLVDVIVKGNTFIHAGTDASGTGDYCIEVIAKENEKPSTVTIYGGTFISGTGHATIQVTSACANRVNAEEAYATSATIYGGYFKASANATVRASSGGYLYIFGGYFYFDADPTAGGGPVRLGTGTDDEATVGNAYVYGGNFVSKSVGAAINCVNDVSKAVVHAAGVNANGGSHLLNSSNSSVDKIYYPDGMAHADGLISMTDGAGVRIIEGSNGLRFVSIVTAEAIAYLESMGATNVKYGTLIAPADVVAQARTFTLADLKAAGLPYLDIEAKDGLVARPSGGYYIRAAITNIKEGNYDREFAAVGYITYTLEVNGEAVTFTVYTSYRDNKNARSIEQVARLALRDGNGYSAAQQAVLEMFAPKTEAPVIDFYLMAGQSNAAGSTQFSDAIASLKPEYTEGYSHIFYSGSSNRARRINVPMKIGYGSAIDSFGAELGMADALSQYYNAETGRYAAIIKYAYGGTRLYDNITGSDGVEGNWMSNTWIERNGCKDEQLSGGLFRGLIAHIASSVADYEAMGYEVNIKSIYWMQGESDISANGKDHLYDEMFKCWVDDVRSNVAEIMGDESYLSLPVLVGEISEYFGSNAGELYHRYNLEFVQMQREIIGSWDNVYVIPQGNVPTVDWPNDNSHWGYHDHLWNGYMTGSKMLELAHGFYTSVSEEDAVAEVWLDDQLLGTYNTLGGAISMAPEGAVVKLLKDIQMYTTLAIGNRNTITLDGCGHKIDFTPKQTTTGNYSALKFFNTDITVKDLHVINHSYTEWDEDGAETNLATYGAVLNFNAKVTWIGGYLEAERHGFVLNNAQCELTIISGDFQLRDTAISYAAVIFTETKETKITVEGGTFNGGVGTGHAVFVGSGASGVKIVLNGGTFTAGEDSANVIKGHSATSTIIVGEGAVLNGNVDNAGLSQ